MITLVVLAILAAVAFPNFEGVMRSNRVATTTNELPGFAVLGAGRGDQERPWCGCMCQYGRRCLRWRQLGDGWMVWADANGDGSFNAGEAIVRISEKGSPKGRRGHCQSGDCL